MNLKFKTRIGDTDVAFLSFEEGSQRVLYSRSTYTKSGKLGLNAWCDFKLEVNYTSGKWSSVEAYFCYVSPSKTKADQTFSEGQTLNVFHRYILVDGVMTRTHINLGRYGEVDLGDTVEARNSVALLEAMPPNLIAQAPQEILSDTNYVFTDGLQEWEMRFPSSILF